MRCTVHRPLWRSTLLSRVLAGRLAACAASPPPGRVYAVRRQPPVRVEVVAVAPGPRHVWVPGQWAWRRGAYFWVPGRWVVPARGYRAWVPGHWARDRRGWYWVEGRWR